MNVWVEGGGPKPAALMIVGESPGEVEERKGEVLVGPTGKENDSLLRRETKISRENVYATNFMKYLTKGKEMSDEETVLMGELLLDEIEEVKPKVILALGAIAVRWFLGDVDMETVNAVPHEWRGITLIPSFHPAAMFHDSPRLAWVISAYWTAGRALRGEIPHRTTECGMTEVSMKGTSNLTEVVAVDTESLDDGTPYLVTFTSAEGEAEFEFCEKGISPELKQHLEAKRIMTVLHNALYDLPVLWSMGVKPARWVDTMVMAFLVQLLPLSLKGLAFNLCGMKIKSYNETVEKGEDLSSLSEMEVLRYSCPHADATLRVYNKLLPMMKKLKADEVLQRDMDIMPMIISMMENGMKLSTNYIAGLQEEFEIRNLGVEYEIEEMAGKHINPASAKQVAGLFYKELKLGKGKRVKKTRWGGSTDQKTMEAIKGEHKVVQMVLDWREIDTLTDKYLNVLPNKIGWDGRIHTKLSLVRVPHSGRLASSNPNLMAQPTRTEDGKKIRDGFVAEEGWELVSFDYNQVEMRIMAHLSQDSAMLDTYENGEDIHTDTARRVFGIKEHEVDEMKHRYPSKRAGFGIINRITSIGLSRELVSHGLPEWTESECSKLLNAWFCVHPGVRKFMDRVCAETKRHGHVTDMWGRMELIPEVRSIFPYIREAGLRRAGNQPIQSGAQGLIKEAMRRLWPILEDMKDIRPLLQIHDDLLFEMRESLVQDFAPDIKTIMESAAKLSVPIVVDVKGGKRWGSMKSIL